MRYGLEFSDIEDDSAIEDIALLLSQQSQSIALAAMYFVQKRHLWLDIVDDAGWDVLQAIIAEAIDQLMRIDFLADFTPVGTVVWFAGLAANVPAKWLRCTGQTLDVVDYPALADVLGDPFYTGGATFTLPDLQNRFLYGASSNSHLGAVSGSTTHTLDVAEMPAHTHTQRGKNTTGGSVFHSQVNAVSTAAGSVATTTPTDAAGNSQPHNNMPPYIRGFFIMKVLP